MSSNHKAPLAAFVVVALACVVVLATNSMRSYARDAWRQLAAPVVNGLTLVPSLGGGSSPAPAAHDSVAEATAPDAATDAHSAVEATPAVSVTKAKPATHRHRHHLAKTTPANSTAPAPPAPQPVAPQSQATPATPAWPAWPAHGPSHSDHPSWPTNAHQPSWPTNTHQPANAHPAADHGNRFDHGNRPTGLNRGPGNRDWQGMTPGRGMHPTANTPYAATHPAPAPSHGSWSGHVRTSWGHGPSSGSHRR